MDKDTLKGIGGLVLTFGLLFGYINVVGNMGEQPSVTGHTDLSEGEALNAPHRGNNYAVFPKARVVYIITTLLPVELRMEKGQLMHVSHAMKTGNILTTRQPASPEEALLWHKYFG